jgi:predicted GIY-YIG superfamily endonuclease
LKRTKSEKKAILKRVGWTIYILECADKTYYAGMVRSFRMQNVLDNIGKLKGIYFSKNPERLPVKIVYEEYGLPFREALAKSDYLKLMNRRQRTKLIMTNKWHIGGPWREYLENKGRYKRIDKKNLTLPY